MSSPKSKGPDMLINSDRQQDEALDSLSIVVGKIGHDFNNILSLIVGYVDMAMSEIPEGERARSDLEHVLAATDRAKDLVAQILTYSKSTKLKQEEIRVEKPFREAVDYLKGRFPSSVALNVEIAENSGGKIISNETEISQIINNLCMNSLQSFNEQGGSIDVELDYFDSDSDFAQQHESVSSGDYARISVTDTGSGMSLDTLEKIYMPFFTTARGDDKSKSRAGLGLTTVNNIVTSLNGVIFVSSSLNAGTKFVVCLPLIDAKPGEELSGVAGAKGSRNILLVDDESSIIEMATQILEKSGYKVSSFIDGVEALEYFRQQPHHFDLVITDLTMPSITGTELALKLSAINPNVPIVLTTGFSEKITSATCNRWNINTVINKPFTIGELLSTIDSLV